MSEPPKKKMPLERKLQWSLVALLVGGPLFLLNYFFSSPGPAVTITSDKDNTTEISYANQQMNVKTHLTRTDVLKYVQSILNQGVQAGNYEVDNNIGNQNHYDFSGSRAQAILAASYLKTWLQQSTPPKKRLMSTLISKNLAPYMQSKLAYQFQAYDFENQDLFIDTLHGITNLQYPPLKAVIQYLVAHPKMAQLLRHRWITTQPLPVVKTKNVNRAAAQLYLATVNLRTPSPKWGDKVAVKRQLLMGPGYHFTNRQVQKALKKIDMSTVMAYRQLYQNQRGLL